MIGTIIGVGIFSVPAVMSAVGVVPAIGIAVLLLLIQICNHLFYTEVVIACKEQKRLPGLVQKYIGTNAYRVTTVVVALQSWGAMTAYVLVGGVFLHTLIGNIFPSANTQMFQLGYGAIIAAIVFVGLRWVSRLGLVTVFGLITALIVLLTGSAAHWQPIPLLTDFSLNQLFLVYGVLLFSFSGAPAIPEMEEIVGTNTRVFRTSVVVGTIIAATLITVFGVMVWGASTMGVSADAVSGLSKSVGPWIGTIGSLLGLLSVSTAFMTIAVNTKEMFLYDVKLRHTSAWLLTVLAPLIVAASGAANVVGVISFSGALFGGATAIMICYLYLVVMKKTQQSKKLLRFPQVLTYMVMVILLIGALGRLLI